MIRSIDLPAADRVLRKAELWVRTRLEGLGPGAHRSVRIGEGIELADIREYTPGDDVRTIDWNVTARTGRPHVRVYDADREAHVFCVVDRSASMAFGTAARTKEALLREVLAAMAALVNRHGDGIGGMLFGDGRVGAVPMGKGRRAALRLLQLVDDVRPQERVRSGLAEAIDETARVLRRRSIVLVVSDWLDGGAWEEPLARLALRHEVIAAEIGDPREALLPDVGPIVLEDPETGRQLEVNTSRRDVREKFAAAVAAQRAARADAIARAGAAHLVVSTDREWLDDLVRFLEHRRRRRR